MFLLVVLIVAIVAVAIGPQRENTVLRVLGGGAVAALLAWSVPRVLLALKAKSRVNRVCRSLPDGRLDPPDRDLCFRKIERPPRHRREVRAEGAIFCAIRATDPAEQPGHEALDSASIPDRFPENC